MVDFKMLSLIIVFPAKKKKKKFDNRVEKSDSKIINEVENLQIHIYIVSSCFLFSPKKYEFNRFFKSE